MNLGDIRKKLSRYTGVAPEFFGKLQRFHEHLRTEQGRTAINGNPSVEEVEKLKKQFHELKSMAARNIFQKLGDYLSNVFTISEVDMKENKVRAAIGITKNDQDVISDLSHSIEMIKNTMLQADGRKQLIDRKKQELKKLKSSFRDFQRIPYTVVTDVKVKEVSGAVSEVVIK